MKKMLSLLTFVSVALSAVSFTSSAEEYEKISMSDFATEDEFCNELSDGIKDGRYFVDFDGNGTFNPIDAALVCEYYADLSTYPTVDDINWDNSSFNVLADNAYYAPFVDDSAEILTYGDTSFRVIPLSSEMLENVQNYGDINGDGRILSDDAACLLHVYFQEFAVGDVNADNHLDAVDASYVLAYYAQKSTGQSGDFCSEQAMSTLGDVNGDGEINSSDASEILSAYSEIAVSE